ncbi:hypothetical protein P170DRAFT_104738 [Aspergillus steynii IBT 23096]|uniref:WSC domain-containing protein n=1 Tax=Aspergillus steynii IBT 23096 TaxID=1392250 RepID=A0A2I2GHX6_9EURO|nr:uncharacterized protein P170DRAFT_104738 [Aspergillus steynii IBT 23096]PLB52447.1 hypothetical protein P170DRAFT_104738 [Aspergillus steynii IBT 23096]
MSRKILSIGLLSFLAFSPSIVSALQHDCYSNIGDLKQVMTSTYQSTGMCETFCNRSDYSVYGLKGDRCWCGDKLPPLSAKVSTKECNTACPGYPSDKCGGDGVWTIISDSSTHPEHSEAQSSSSEPKSSTKNYPMGTLSVNPTVVQTGAASQTSIPSNILTAPTMDPKNEMAEASALAATQASSSSSSSASSSADPESSSNVAVVPASPASVGSLVGAILLPLVLGSAF